jgi:hypothetical protein
MAVLSGSYGVALGDVAGVTTTLNLTAPPALHIGVYRHKRHGR